MLNKIILKTLLLISLSMICMSEAPKISEKEFKVRESSEKLQKEGKIKEAIAAIDEWEKNSKKSLHPNLYEYRGSLWASLNDFQKAKENYFKAYEIYPTIHNVTSLGYCHLSLEDYFVAENVFRAAMIKYPGEQNLKKGLLQCLFHQKRYVEAKALVNSLLIKNSNEVELIEILGQIYWQEGRHLKAFENYQFIYLLNKATSKHYYALLDLSLLLNLPVRASDYAGKLLKTDNKIDSQRAENIALSFLNLKDFVNAKKWVRVAIKYTPINVKKDHLLIYLAEAMKETNLKDAKKIMGDVKDPLVKKGRYYFLLGTLSDMDQEKHKAIAYFLEAKSYEPYRKPSLWKLYNLYQLNNDYANCLKTLSDLEKLEPDNNNIKKLMIYYSKLK